MRAPSSGWRFISTICDSVSLVGELRTSGGTFSLPTSCSSAAVPESWTKAAAEAERRRQRHRQHRDVGDVRDRVGVVRLQRDQRDQRVAVVRARVRAEGQHQALEHFELDRAGLDRQPHALERRAAAGRDEAAAPAADADARRRTCAPAARTRTCGVGVSVAGLPLSSAAIVSMNAASSARVTPRDTVEPIEAALVEGPEDAARDRRVALDQAVVGDQAIGVRQRRELGPADGQGRDVGLEPIEDLDVARMIGRVEPAARHRALQLAEERLGAERRAHETSRRPPRTVLHSPAAERCQARAAAWPCRSGLAASACTMTCDTRRGPPLKM